MPKAKRSAKQIAAATKTILAFEEKQKAANMLLNDREVFSRGVEFGKALVNHNRFVMGLVVGGSVVFIAQLIVRGLSV